MFLIFFVVNFSDMKIKVTDIVTNDVKELSGHEGAIFGLSLDPKEEFLVSKIMVHLCGNFVKLFFLTLKNFMPNRHLRVAMAL